MIEWADCKGTKVEEELTQIFSSGQWMIDSEVSQSQNEQVIQGLAHCPGGGQLKSHSQNEQVVHGLAHCPGGGQLKSHSHDK